LKICKLALLSLFTHLVFCFPILAAIPDPCGCDPELLKVADSGNSDMQIHVAFLYLTGKEGVDQDYEKARYWYKRIINEHSADGQLMGNAYLRMAIMHTYGKGGPRDYQKAMACYKKATEYGYYDAHYGIGCLYMNGLGVKQDYQKALRWLEVAAEHNHTHAIQLVQHIKKKLAVAALSPKMPDSSQQS
jgi:TPR repeat protein